MLDEDVPAFSTERCISNEMLISALTKYVIDSGVLAPQTAGNDAEKLPFM
jgi:hypothetical protein